MNAALVVIGIGSLCLIVGDYLKTKTKEFWDDMSDFSNIDIYGGR